MRNYSWSQCLALAGLAAAQMLAAQTPVREFIAPLDALKAAIGLSDEQVARLQQLQRDRAEASRQQWELISQKQRALTDMLNSGTTDATELGRKMLEIRELQNRPEPGEGGNRDRALAVLTPEQKKKLKTLDDALRLRTAVDQAVTAGLISAPPEGAGK